MSARAGDDPDSPEHDHAPQQDQGPSAGEPQEQSQSSDETQNPGPAPAEPQEQSPAPTEPQEQGPAPTEPQEQNRSHTESRKPGEGGPSEEPAPTEETERGGSAGPRPSDADRSSTPGTLSPTMMAGAPQRPPRRTGVFLDPDDLREHVGGLLRAILGGYEVDGFGNFTFQHEGARAFVTVGPSPIGPQVGIFSVTNLDLDLSPPLASFLLTTNHQLGFGAFSYDESNRAVWLRHTLLGSTLDLPELQSAVAAVATTAAALDETIRDRFGGRTFSEAPEDVQQHLEPPDAAGSPRPPNASGYL